MMHFKSIDANIPKYPMDFFLNVVFWFCVALIYFKTHLMKYDKY